MIRLYRLLDPLVYARVLACHDWAQSSGRVSPMELARRYDVPLHLMAQWLIEVEVTQSVTVPSCINAMGPDRKKQVMKYATDVKITCKSPEDARELRLTFAGYSSTLSQRTEGATTVVTTTLPLSRLSRSAKKALGYMPGINMEVNDG